jgi:hypothetical protein
MTTGAFVVQEMPGVGDPARVPGATAGFASLDAAILGAVEHYRLSRNRGLESPSVVARAPDGSRATVDILAGNRSPRIVGRYQITQADSAEATSSDPAHEPDDRPNPA